MNENEKMCFDIAEELKAAVRGDMYRCPECGEVFKLYEDGNYETADEAADEIEKAMCPRCGHVSEYYNDFEPFSVYDFFSDFYDIEFRVDHEKEFRSVRVMVACGGPNIYIDTASGDVELYWWNERARWCMSGEAVEAVNDWAEEYWGCM